MSRLKIIELTIVAIRKLTTLFPLIKLYISPNITFLNTNSSRMGPTVDIKIINKGISCATFINLAVLGLLFGAPNTYIFIAPQ